MSVEPIQKIIVGTAQMGMDYGVTNRVGKWNQSDVNQLIRFASNLKIKTYDSAFAYGNAHEVLREAIESSAENVSILTKSGSKNSSELRQDLESAFNLFGDQLYGFSLHSFSQFENEEVRSEWNQIKDQYPSLRMGISVYDDRELVASLESGLFHFVQASGNIFNLNKVRRSLFSKYVSKGFEIHIRSVFLQGLLVTPADQLPDHLRTLETKIRSYHQLCDKLQKSPQEVAMSYPLALAEVSKVVLGVDSIEQFEQNCSRIQKLDSRQFQMIEGFIENLNFNAQEERALDPRSWTSLKNT